MTKYDWIVLVLVWTLAITIFVAYNDVEVDTNYEPKRKIDCSSVRQTRVDEVVDTALKTQCMAGQYPKP